MEHHQIINELAENDEETLKSSCRILVKICDNILNHPAEEKYRKLRLTNSNIESLIATSGAISALFLMGFEEGGEYLLLPSGADLAPVRSLHNAIKDLLTGENPAKLVNQNEADNATSSNATNAHESKSQDAPSQSTPISIYDQHWHITRFPDYPSNVQDLEFTFFRRLQSSFDHVLIYENPALQEKARAVIPSDRLMQQAQAKYDVRDTTINLHLTDFYIVELMDWYREDFFRWVNSPKCDRCGSETVGAGSGTPTADDQRYGASRVELYRCSTCGTMTRFPRYNDPGKLLETRQGRCGEWANCFTLICRASGYESRHVLDWTDHVWTEVYSQSQKRWLHCDPGEKALDKPLLYESGWGKKLTYIVAFSKDDINDVTWRYSGNHRALIMRRTACREKWLTTVIEQLRAQRQATMAAFVKRIHQMRLIVEFGEFISSKRQPSAGDMIGRLTGSEDWRRGRGELGVHPSHTFTIDNTNGDISVDYCCASNKYSLCNGSTCASLHGWEAGVHEQSNMFRNTEVDWNMTYLARQHGTDHASISWAFDLKDSKTTAVNIRVNSAKYENGRVDWCVVGEDKSGNRKKVSIEANSPNDVSAALMGCCRLTLTADLSQGRNEKAWQHTQLFRQSRDSADSMMEISISYSQ